MGWCVVASEIDWTVVGPYFFLVTIAVVVSSLIAATLAEKLGRDPTIGALIGTLLGPVGWFVIAMIGRRRS